MLKKERRLAESFFTSYLVRVYRFKKDKPWSLVGLVEETGTKGRRAFTNYDELWEILNNPQKERPKERENHRLSPRIQTCKGGNNL